MNFKKILYPTDFSDKGESAKEATADLAKKMNSKIYILHAIEPLKYDEFDKEIESFYEDLKSKLKNKMQIVSDYFDALGLDNHSSFVIGPRWKVVNTYAKEMGIGLIILGSHGLKDKRGELLVGTTSHKVMFTSPCPVLIVRNDYSDLEY